MNIALYLKGQIKYTSVVFLIFKISNIIGLLFVFIQKFH